MGQRVKAFVKPASTGFCVAVLAAILGGLAAEAADMATAIKDRQAHFKEIGKATKAMVDQVKSPTPTLAVIQASAKTIDSLAPQLPSWFPAGSGPEAGVKTGAKAEIWTKADEFKKDAAAFASEAHKFDMVAAGGDIGAIRMQAQAMGQTCKTCHQAFRQKDD